MRIGRDAHVGIWVEASEQIGFGHLVRMLVLARMLRRFGARVTFLTPRGSLAVPAVRREGLTLHLLASGTRDQQSRSALPLIVRNRMTHLAIDLPEALSPATLRILRKTSAALVLLDDLGSVRKLVDLTINAIDHMPYSRIAKGHGRVLEGPQYMILHDAFSNSRPVSVRKRASHLIFSFGGSDPANLTYFMLEAVRCLPRTIHLTCLLGPGYHFTQQLRTAARHSPIPAHIHHEIERPWELFRTADLVFTHFGITVYELARLGVPTALLHPTIYHDRVAQVFARRGSVLNLGFFKTLKREMACRKISALLDDTRLRVDLAARGRTIVDGQGAARVARRILHTKRYS